MIDTAVTVDELAALLRRRRWVALTGAGISTDSGIPDYRGAGSRPTSPIQYDDFLRSADVRRRYWARSLLGFRSFGRALPNTGHRALAALADRGLGTVITQNVDGLHRRAGSHNVLELHGNLFRAKCFSEDRPVESGPDGDEVPPRCPRCGGLLRPDVVWFGEMLPASTLHAAEHAALTADIFFSIGTSALVYPAADLPFSALAAGVTVVEINPQPTPLSPHVTFSLHGAAGAVLPALVARVWEAG